MTTLRRISIGALLAALLLTLTACGGSGAAEDGAASSVPAGKPLFTGDFVTAADQVDPPEEEGESAHQTMQVGMATITLGRFPTNHAAEAYLDNYHDGGSFELHEGVELPGGEEGNHYRWRSGSNEDSTVNDAVIAEADGYSLLFLCRDSLDAFEGDAESGPDKATVEGWVRGLTVQR